MGIFLLVAAIVASLAGTTLLWRGTILKRIWVLNPRAYHELVPLGKSAGVSFILLGITLAITGTGWFKRRFWAWRAAVAIIAIQVLGDFANIFLGRIVEGAIGAIIAGVLLFYLLRAPVRSAFERGGA
jgi:hypothetical protein